MKLNLKQKVLSAKKAVKNAILIIDDEEIIRDILIEVMELANFSAFSAQTGQEGLDIFIEHHNKIKLVLLDMVMPGLSGLETYDKLLQVDPKIKVILMSGYPNKEAINALDLPKHQEFIQKPFSVDEVISKVRQALP